VLSCVFIVYANRSKFVNGENVETVDGGKFYCLKGLHTLRNVKNMPLKKKKKT